MFCFDGYMESFFSCFFHNFVVLLSVEQVHSVGEKCYASYCTNNALLERTIHDTTRSRNHKSSEISVIYGNIIYNGIQNPNRFNSSTPSK